MDKIKETMEEIRALDEDAMESARARQDTLTKPQHSLGILEDISVKIAGITTDFIPELNDKVIITMAGDHGITEEGVSACLLYTSPSPRDRTRSRMPSSA